MPSWTGGKKKRFPSRLLTLLTFSPFEEGPTLPPTTQTSLRAGVTHFMGVISDLPVYGLGAKLIQSTVIYWAPIATARCLCCDNALDSSTSLGTGILMCFEALILFNEFLSLLPICSQPPVAQINPGIKWCWVVSVLGPYKFYLTYKVFLILFILLKPKLGSQTCLAYLSGDLSCKVLQLVPVCDTQLCFFTYPGLPIPFPLQFTSTTWIWAGKHQPEHQPFLKSMVN